MLIDKGCWMSLDTIQEIERAIGMLSASERQELYVWLEQNYPHPMDARISSDLADGKLDDAIYRALGDEADGRLRTL